MTSDINKDTRRKTVLVSIAIILCLGLLATLVYLDSTSRKAKRMEPSWTDIYVGYTEVRYIKGLVGKKRSWVHSLVIADNPRGEDYYVSAGGSDEGYGSSSSRSGSRSCHKKGQLCAVSESLTNSSTDKMVEIAARQKIGRVNMPFKQVKRLMDKAAKEMNKMEMDYKLLYTNCNTFAFTFLNNWLGINASPNITVKGSVNHAPGWDSNTLMNWTP